MSSADVIIIGAGASGLMCAMEAGKRGRRVIVVDHSSKIGQKILISGGGRSNFTNLRICPENYISSNPHFVKSAIARFKPKDFLDLLDNHHIPFYEKEKGRMFCKKSSRDILRMLTDECNVTKVKIIANCKVFNVEKKESFIVNTSSGNFATASLVIATGGVSYPKLGASTFGHDIAKLFGLSVTPLKPALVPFVFGAHDKNTYGKLSGISVLAKVSCGKKTFLDNVLFTHRGISGPAILQISSYWSKGSEIALDLLPNTDILKILMEHHGATGKLKLKTVLSHYLTKRLAETWCDEHKYPHPIGQLSLKDIKNIAHNLHNLKLAPKDTEGYDKAEVTLGGVDTDEISSKTMESHKVKNLYFIGEVLDVTGQLGGYNLHWAWAAGFAAGQVV